MAKHEFQCWNILERNLEAHMCDSNLIHLLRKTTLLSLSRLHSNCLQHHFILTSDFSLQLVVNYYMKVKFNNTPRLKKEDYKLNINHYTGVFNKITCTVLASIHTCDFLGVNYCVNYCMNYILNCDDNCLDNHRCECTHLVQYNPLLCE